MLLLPGPIVQRTIREAAHEIASGEEHTNHDQEYNHVPSSPLLRRKHTSALNGVQFTKGSPRGTVLR
jgi:hypothetical protein